MAQKQDKKPDLRDKSGPGVAIDTEDAHSVLDRKKTPQDDPDLARGGSDNASVPEGQNIKSGA